jgi:hypothetical protein
VYSVLWAEEKQNPDGEGLGVDEVVKRVVRGGGEGMRAVVYALDDLAEAGLVYSTVDEDTFAVLLLE